MLNSHSLTERSGAFVGVALGTFTVVALTLIPKPTSLELLMLTMPGIAGIYWGFAVEDGSVKSLVLETLGLSLFLTLAFFARANSAKILATAYLLHSAWDVLHHWKVIPTKVRPWYPSFCFVYDAIVGGFLWYFL